MDKKVENGSSLEYAEMAEHRQTQIKSDRNMNRQNIDKNG